MHRMSQWPSNAALKKIFSIISLQCGWFRALQHTHGGLVTEECHRLTHGRVGPKWF